MLWPSLALTCRRLHDVNRSGWNQLWPIVPVLSSFVLVVIANAYAQDESMVKALEWMVIIIYLLALSGSILLIALITYLGCTRGTTGPNKYGPDLLENIE